MDVVKCDGCGQEMKEEGPLRGPHEEYVAWCVNPSCEYSKVSDMTETMKIIQDRMSK